jgi:hypothetical protein
MFRPTPRQLALVVAFLLAVFAWVVALLLLLEVTRVILEALHQIIEVAQLG